MKKLSELQNQFQDYLLHVDSAIKRQMIGSKKVSIQTRLAIYENAYYARLLEVLETTYPLLKKYVGEEAFHELGYDYIHQYPSIYRSIRWFGHQLDRFIAEQTEYQNSPYLAEIAKFEWTMAMAFDAADATAISLQEVAKIAPGSWGDMRFTLHPSAQQLELKWNVAAMWNGLFENKQPVQPMQSPSPVNWILWRKNLMNQFCSLPPEEAWAIRAMSGGQTFGEICEGLCQWKNEEDAPLFAASLLKGWITAELICDVSV